jgi:hypothetical protein
MIELLALVVSLTALAISVVTLTCLMIAMRLISADTTRSQPADDVEELIGHASELIRDHARQEKVNRAREAIQRALESVGNASGGKAHSK